ncbi:MAG TPA: GNAT family N-acetyltransferase [Candidatus Limiplasma sp.]|nr:GNAT family N-acetyltransferase [Candidatus Limiplasma sp.]HRX09557.1 GNAT family N-acetyltransferase [Candidatus Limiplasma sp.]
MDEQGRDDNGKGKAMETKRLILRRFLPEDFPAFAELIRNKMASALSVYDQQFPTDDKGLREVLEYIKNLDGFFAVLLKAERRLIGFVTLHPVGEDTYDFGYCIHTEYQGKGYATEATISMIAFAKDVLHARKLSASTAECNTPSVRLLERAGFVRVGSGSASFAKDAQGNPIVFPSLDFELRL